MNSKLFDRIESVSSKIRHSLSVLTFQVFRVLFAQNLTCADWEENVPKILWMRLIQKPDFGATKTSSVPFLSEVLCNLT